MFQASSSNGCETALAALAATLAPVAVLAPKGVVPLLILASLAAAWTAWHRAGWRPHAAAAGTWLLLAFAGLALAGAVWSPQPGAALRKAAELVALIALGGLLRDLAADLAPPARRRVAAALMAGLGLAAALMLLELASDHVLYRTATGRLGDALPALDSRLNRGATTLALLGGPVIAWLLAEGRRGQAAALGAAVLAAILAGASLAALLALGAAAALGLLAGPRPGAAAAVLALGGVSAAALPWLAGGLETLGQLVPELPESARHRLYIWDFVAARILESPWVGHGFDSSGLIPNHGVVPFHPDADRVIPSHPHSAALQLWLELGVPGIALGLAVLAVAARRVLARPPLARAGAAAALAAALVVALLSYGVWQSQWIATLLAVAAMVTVCCPAAAARESGGESGGEAGG